MVSARGAKPRGRVNFLYPTSNTIPSPLLLPGEACSTKIVRDIFFIQPPTLFHHHYFRREKRAPLRSCETWPCLNSCSRLVQSKETPMGAYLAHPSIKAEAKAGKQVHDSFLNSLHLPIFLFYLVRSVLHLDTPSCRSHPMVDRAMNCPMEESPEVILARPRICVMLRSDREGSSMASPPESQSLLLAISSNDDGGG